MLYDTAAAAMSNREAIPNDLRMDETDLRTRVMCGNCLEMEVGMGMASLFLMAATLLTTIDSSI